MMEKRPIVCVTDTDGKFYPLGGNMRLRAIQELKIKEIPDTWVMFADEWTIEQRNEFTIKDNVGFGEWDWDILANEWNNEELEAWGLDLPVFDTNILISKTEQLKDFARSHVLISYHPDNHDKIQRLLEELNELSNIEIEIASN